ncbi:MAG: hypothetical protein ABIN67_14425, partial [Ferruginibacter sp.]
LLIFSLMIVLIIKERRQQKGRWVFPFTLGLYLILYTLMITQIRIGPWEAFSRWFVALPLT